MINKFKKDENGLIPLLIVLLFIILAIIYVAFMRVTKAHH